MTTSKTIAGLIGPTLVAIAAGMLLNIGSFPTLAEQVSRDPALIFVSGILLFVAGLAIVPPSQSLDEKRTWRGPKSANTGNGFHSIIVRLCKQGQRNHNADRARRKFNRVGTSED